MYVGNMGRELLQHIWCMRNACLVRPCQLFDQGRGPYSPVLSHVCVCVFSAGTCCFWHSQAPALPLKWRVDSSVKHSPPKLLPACWGPRQNLMIYAVHACAGLEELGMKIYLHLLPSITLYRSLLLPLCISLLQHHLQEP